jgi:bifunctional DNase/RNase
MSKPVVEVQVRAMAVTSGGCAVFLGNEDKVFVMFVDQSVGTAITMFMQGTKKERPLTHDLLANILRALGAKIERVIVNDFKRGTYFARLVLSAENESQQKKIIEIDARPSDCIAMATAQHAPIYVSLDVWDEVEDMTEALRKMQEEGSHGDRSESSQRNGEDSLTGRRSHQPERAWQRLSIHCSSVKSSSCSGLFTKSQSRPNVRQNSRK